MCIPQALGAGRHGAGLARPHIRQLHMGAAGAVKWQYNVCTVHSVLSVLLMADRSLFFLSVNFSRFFLQPSRAALVSGGRVRAEETESVSMNSRYTERLQSLQRIRALVRGEGGHFELRLPQICVVGDQTSGKSSLLNCLTGVRFPEKSGICTRAPIVVECRCDKSLPGDEFQIYDVQPAGGGTYKRVCAEELAAEITRAQTVLLAASKGNAESGDSPGTDPMVCSDEIKVKVAGPQQIDIIVVDLPGIISSGPGVAETLELVHRYTEPKQTLILLVSEAEMDDQRVAALDCARQVDSQGERTMRILTKFDALEKHSAETQAQAVELVSSGLRQMPSVQPHEGVGEGVTEPAAKRRRLSGGGQHAEGTGEYCERERGVDEEGAVGCGGTSATSASEHLGASCADLRPHAVVCRSKGGNGSGDKMEYNEATEAAVLAAYNLPRGHGGIPALQRRLPPIFSRLVDQNLPALQDSAKAKRDEAEEELRRIGGAAFSSEEMISAAQAMLAAAGAKFEEDISREYEEFKEAVHQTEQKITQEFVDGNFHANVFQPPFFQGKAAFEKCLEQIARWWDPVLERYLKKLEAIARGMVVDAPRAPGSCVLPERFTRFLSAAWAGFFRDRIVGELRSTFQKTLQREVRFGTSNHYLEAQYMGDMLVPEEVVDRFCESLQPQDFFQTRITVGTDGKLMVADAHKAPAFGAAFGGPPASAAPVASREFSVEEHMAPPAVMQRIRSNLKKRLRTARTGWATEFAAKSLDEQQRRRVWAAVKAAWAVEKKTFSDMILKETRDHVVEARQRWIHQELRMVPGIQENAVENEEVTSRRTHLKDLISAMDKSLEELKLVL